MTPPWITAVQLIQNGEPVDAQTDNRPLQQLTTRTEYLKELVDIITGAKGVYNLNAALAPDVYEGAAVYWNSATLRYELAKAALDYNNDGIYGQISDSAYCLGICVSKSNPVRGAVMFSGVAEDVDFSTSIGSPIEAGPYFLSAVEPGKLVKVRPPVGIVVLFMMSSTPDLKGTAFVMPTPRELLEDHIHYRLLMEYGNVVGTPGWTAAFDTAIAPAGAVYRYTHESDAPIKNLFPFLPPESQYVEIDGIGGNDKVTITMTGIWWMDSVHVPSDYQTMTIYYTKMVAKTNNTMVASLQAESADSPVSFVDCYGRPANAGNLYARFSLALANAGDDTAGYLAFKQVQGSQGLLRGPIVESVISASPELSVSIQPVEGVDQGLQNTDGSYAGKLVLSFADQSSRNREGSSSQVALYNATEESVNGVIPYIGLPASYASSAAFRFDVPTTLVDGSYTFSFKTWLYAPEGGVLPALTCDYYILPQTQETAPPPPMPVISTTPTTASLVIPIPNVIAGNYVMAHLPDITVQPGAQVYIAVKRLPSDGYDATVGILRTYYTMSKVV